MTEEKTKKRRGFAAMDPALQRELAVRGGKAAHAKGTAHEFTAEEAREAGKKGARVSHERRRARERAERGEREGASDART